VRRVIWPIVGIFVCVSCATHQYARDAKWGVKPVVLAKGQTPETADNSFCAVCHANYNDEKLATVHKEAGVGCETCHGLSDQHSQDENGMTAPDILWSPQRIVPRCLTCHPKERLLANEEASALHQEALATGSSIHCAKCHGKKHRLKTRTRVWDKETGKLLKWSGGPKMDGK